MCNIVNIMIFYLLSRVLLYYTNSLRIIYGRRDEDIDRILQGQLIVSFFRLRSLKDERPNLLYYVQYVQKIYFPAQLLLIITGSKMILNPTENNIFVIKQNFFSVERNLLHITVIPEVRVTKFPLKIKQLLLTKYT